MNSLTMNTFKHIHNLKGFEVPNVNLRSICKLTTSYEVAVRLVANRERNDWGLVLEVVTLLS